MSGAQYGYIHYDIATKRKSTYQLRGLSASK
jgi:hypothetical protein